MTSEYITTIYRVRNTDINYGTSGMFRNLLTKYNAIYSTPNDAVLIEQFIDLYNGKTSLFPNNNLNANIMSLAAGNVIDNNAQKQVISNLLGTIYGLANNNVLLLEVIEALKGEDSTYTVRTCKFEIDNLKNNVSILDAQKTEITNRLKNIENKYTAEHQELESLRNLCNTSPTSSHYVMAKRTQPPSQFTPASSSSQQSTPLSFMMAKSVQPPSQFATASSSSQQLTSSIFQQPSSLSSQQSRVSLPQKSLQPNTSTHRLALTEEEEILDRYRRIYSQNTDLE